MNRLFPSAAALFLLLAIACGRSVPAATPRGANGDSGSGGDGKGGTGGGETGGYDGAGGFGGDGGFGGETGGAGGETGGAGGATGGAGGAGGGNPCDGAVVNAMGRCVNGMGTPLDATCCTYDCSSQVTCRRPMPNCAAGQAPSVVNGCWGPCVPADSCKELPATEKVCIDTGGRWGVFGCGSSTCGTFVLCPRPSAGCFCSVTQTFDDVKGCVEDAKCKDPQTLCQNTGGTWDPTSCGDYVCGVKPACQAIVPGCNCGDGQNYVKDEGCAADVACYSGLGGTCGAGSGKICLPGLRCLPNATGANTCQRR